MRYQRIDATAEVCFPAAFSVFTIMREAPEALHSSIRRIFRYSRRGESYSHPLKPANFRFSYDEEHVLLLF